MRKSVISNEKECVCVRERGGREIVRNNAKLSDRDSERVRVRGSVT